VNDRSAAEAWREQQRAVYSTGDPEFLARQQAPLAEDLVATAGVRAGERVLDIGAGTGNVAILAARLGAAVIAVDLTPRQVEIGQRRSADEALEIGWHVADAEQLPCQDGTIDVALSNFGVIYAAQPRAAAAEVLRVLAPGGRALFTAYPADSFNGQALTLIERYLPSGDDQPVVDEHRWADEDALRQWFPECGITVQRRSREGEPLASAAAWWDVMQDVPIGRRLRETLPADRYAEFRDEIVELRSRYARFEPDGTMTPLNDHVVGRIDPRGRRR